MNLNNYNNDISDLPLIGNPQISFFSKVFRKHTHFYTFRKKMTGVKEGNENRIDYHGDLIKSIDLEIKITNNTSSDMVPHNIGTSLLNKITMRSTFKEIESLSGSYIEMYYQLNNPRGLQTFYENDSTLVCKSGTMEQILSLSGGVYNAYGVLSTDINIVLPIPFSFFQHTSTALPYFLFFHQSLVIIFNINAILPAATHSYNLIINYIYLREEEKMRFKSSQNEYIIQRIYEHTLPALTPDKNIHDINRYYGNIKSIMWKNAASKNYKYNISINDIKLFKKNKTYHYFTRHNIRKSGLLGGGVSISTASPLSASLVASDDSIALYTFGLDEKAGETPSGSVSSNKNKITITIEIPQSADVDKTFKLYIKTYNLIKITEDNIKIEYTE